MLFATIGFTQEHGDPVNGIMTNQMANAPDSNYMLLTKTFQGVDGVQEYVKFDSVVKNEILYSLHDNVSGVTSVVCGFTLPNAGTTPDSTIRKQLSVYIGGSKIKYKGNQWKYTIDNGSNTIVFPYCRRTNIEIFYNQRLK